MSCRHLNADDRIKIDTLLKEKHTYTHIAKRVGVDKSTISREIKRNGSKPKPKRLKKVKRPKILDQDGRKTRGSGFTKLKYEAIAKYNAELAVARQCNNYYSPSAANKKAKARRKSANQLRTRLVEGSGSFLEQYVLEKLTSEQWSPQQIAGRLDKDYSIEIYHRTIYRYIGNSSQKATLVKHLRRGGSKYRKKPGTTKRATERRAKLPSIHDRAAVIEDRTRLGDLEGDTIVGLDTKDRLLTHVDRSSGECSIDLILSFNAKKIAKQTKKRAKATKTNIASITYDRGTEFAEYEAIQNNTNIKVYFADPYSSHQRGTNENLNGLVRQYFPKRSDFKKITNKQVHAVETKLNNRPRKRYDYRTPLEQSEYLSNLQDVAFRDEM